MRTFFIFLIFFSALSFKKYGSHIWRGSRISRIKFELQVTRDLKFDMLNVFENECECNFEGVLLDTKKNDKILLEYSASKKLIRVYLNEEFKTENSNSGKCFKCIENKCK